MPKQTIYNLKAKTSMRTSLIVLVVGIILLVGLVGYNAVHYFSSPSPDALIPISNNSESPLPESPVAENVPSNVQLLNASPLSPTPTRRSGGGGGGGGGGSGNQGGDTPPIDTTNTTTNSTNQTDLDLMSQIYAVAINTNSYNFTTTQFVYQTLNETGAEIIHLTNGRVDRTAYESFQAIEIQTWINTIFISLLNLNVETINGTVVTSSPTWNDNYTRNLTTEVFDAMDRLKSASYLLNVSTIISVSNETINNQTYYAFELNVTAFDMVNYLNTLEIPAPMRAPPFNDYPLSSQARVWVDADSLKITKTYVFTSSLLENNSLMVSSDTVFSSQ